jgi:hypothetical protein
MNAYFQLLGDLMYQLRNSARKYCSTVCYPTRYHRKANDNVVLYLKLSVKSLWKAALNTMSPAYAQKISSTTGIAQQWVPALTAGPYWPSFEQFRKSGINTFEKLVPGTVGTLRCKESTFRIMLDSDFQKLLGLATEVHRLKQGVTIVVQAAKVVAKHNDEESIQLLLQTASMLNQSNLLPERDGHGEFQITPEERSEFSGEHEEIIHPSLVPRPVL